MAHTLPELPYAYGALEPHIDADTMEIHHTKHHQSYIDKLTAAIKDTEFADAPIEQLIVNLHSLPVDLQTAVRNHGGGHANHSLFWTVLAPPENQRPGGELEQAINDVFGSYDQFAEALSSAAAGQFGSGWAWLTVKNSTLAVTATPNQDSPLTLGVTPILGIDVWEHAYYLKYQNRRAEYIKAFFKVVNWEEVSRRFKEAKGRQ